MALAPTRHPGPVYPENHPPKLTTQPSPRASNPSEPRVPPPPVDLQVSTDLDGIAQELRQLTSVSKRADAVLSDAHAEIPTGLRNDLSQLHGHANSLLATRLDAILTGELHSGRDQARARRKDLIRAAEALIERIEQQVRTIDQRTGK